jgi:glycine/D-amino acid oxidase-like deaminating enzyme
MQVDFLIIGQGLAGSLLAWTLIQRGCRVVVVDNNFINASQVAAGIVNPISGKRLVKTADIEILLPSAINCYDQLSAFFKNPFYIRKTMFRLFRNDSERMQALKRLYSHNYDAYLSGIPAQSQLPSGFVAPYGYIEQKQCGHLLIVSLLSSLNSYFIAKDSYRQSVVDYQYLDFTSKPRWHDISANQVIFCEGHQVIYNPWFNGLPFQSVKGEVLTLNQSNSLPDAIMNYGNWLLPSASGSFRIGATFDRLKVDNQITEQGKDALLNALKTFHPALAEASIVKHEAGIRPCSSDRYPIIGRHPHNRQLAIFNGFGAKGSLQIPWYSERFVDYLLLNVPLPSSCDIRRFESNYLLN